MSVPKIDNFASFVHKRLEERLMEVFLAPYQPENETKVYNETKAKLDKAIETEAALRAQYQELRPKRPVYVKENRLQFLWSEKKGFPWELCAAARDTPSTTAFNISSVDSGPTAWDAPGNALMELRSPMAPVPEVYSRFHVDERVYSAVLTMDQRVGMPFEGNPRNVYMPLFRRASHDHQIDAVLDAIKLALFGSGPRRIRITGASGIGKTVSLMLVLAEAAKLGIDIVCHVSGDTTWMHYGPDGTLYIYDSVFLPRSLDSRTTLVLYDPCGDFSLEKLRINNAVVCFAASPKEFKTRRELSMTTFFTYSWTDAEFMAILPHVSTNRVPREEVDLRRYVFGNILFGLYADAYYTEHALRDFVVNVKGLPKGMDEIRHAFGRDRLLHVGFKLSLPAIGQRVSFTDPDPSLFGPASEWYAKALGKHMEVRRAAAWGRIFFFTFFFGAVLGVFKYFFLSG